MKQHYVHGNGPEGIGYYHLLTKQSYKILQRRIRPMIQPTGYGIFRKREYTIPSPRMRELLQRALDVISKRAKMNAPQEVEEKGLAVKGAGLGMMDDMVGATRFRAGWTG